MEPGITNRPRVVVFTDAGHPDPALAIAASRYGALGVLNLEFAVASDEVLAALNHLSKHARAPFGVLLDGSDAAFLTWILSNRPEGLETVIVTAGFADDAALSAAAKSIHAAGLSARAVVTSLSEAQRCERVGFDGLVAKGSEAGGWVGEETAFVLAQHLRGVVGLPVWLQGGIGLHSAAA